ncbi:MAG: transglutaminaseTgpA domain-containing protein [Planctomycetia bacterium]|nr:transglutaminaseTgpA domain-containing protein [Planctomycetia bacterium]
MKNALSISFAITAILATFMLQLGEEEQNMSLISLMISFVILAGVYLADIQKIFSISNLLCNLIIILIVLLHLETLRTSPMEFIAFSIANILVYIQAVLFFKKKDFRGRIHLLTLSFILACVSTVSRQDLLFATFMILYFFSFVCTVALLLLDQERSYYETHAFVRPPFGRDKSEKNKAPFHFIRLILGTIFLTPFFLLFGYKKDRSEEKYSDILNPQDARRSPWSLGKESKIQDRIFGFWESAESDVIFSGPAANNLVFEKGSRKKKTNSFALLRSRPTFSGASRLDQRSHFSFAFVRKIVFAIIGCLVFASIIFLFFPRFQRIEFYGFRIGHDRWESRISSVRSSVGFSDSIYLGELGPMFDNHEAVLKVNLKDVNKDAPYPIQSSEYLYLRGATLVHYKNRQWSRIANYIEMKFLQNEILPNSMEPARIFRSRENAYRAGLFNKKHDLVCSEITALPNNTGILFAFWPFFRIQGDCSDGVFDGERFVNENNQYPVQKVYRLYTNIFSNGVQQDLIPNQEAFDNMNLYLGIDQNSLPGLIAKAKKWDAEAGLPSWNYIERARNLTQHLRSSGEFTYSRGYINRNNSLDPLEDFTMEHRTGHCEYFAGSLAMMLRAVGIPARIVIGFKFLHEPGSGGDTVVRQSDAHSWVEAYIPRETFEKNQKEKSAPLSGYPSPNKKWWNYGAWLRLDATPYSDEAIMDTVSRNYYTWTGLFKDFWNTYILNFNSSRQRTSIYQPVSDLVKQEKQRLMNKEFWTNFIPVLKEQFDLFIASLKGGKWNMENFLGFVVPSTMLLIFLGLLIYIIRKVLRLYARRIKRREEAINFLSKVYGKLEFYFSRWGIRRNISETSREFVLRAVQEDKFEEALKYEFRKKNPDSEVEPLRADLEIIRRDFRIQSLDAVEEWYQFRFGENK